MKIKKVISACLVLTCLVTGLSGCGKTDQVSDTAERSVIKLGSDSYPPYNYLNEDGVPTGIGVAFSKNETRDLPEKLEQTLDEMREDGTSAKIIGKYLEDPEKYLEVDQLEEE